ncbi:MAG: glycosyltransferase family 2 protein [Mucilaginibacter sp.]
MIIVIAATFFFIILRFSVTLFNFLSNPKLHRVAKQYTDKVSILIPARDEADNILALLQSINNQDYPHYEVIVLDDDSTDQTYNIVADFAAKHPQFKIIKGAELPHYWLGKNYACYQLAEQATGNLFLFLDADEKISNGLINSALHRMYQRKLSLLSLFANQEMHSPGEKLVVPLMHYILLNLLPLQLVYLVKSAAVAAASGQFMLFNGADYRKNQWHQQVSYKVVEDVEIMKLVKASGYNGEALLSNNMVTCRMYKGYKEAVNGFSKNFLAAFNYNIFGFLIYILLVIAGPMIVMMTFDFQLIFLMAGLIILTRIMISLSVKQNAMYNVILHPVQMFSLTLIAFTAIQKHLTKTNVWKGRKI